MTQPLGLRVLRGPDWDRGDEDGGEGHVGTVIELLSNHTVLVLWDTGQESTCRAGTDGKFDLRIFDTAQIGVRHLGTKCSECDEENILGMLWRCKDCVGVDLCTLCYNDDKHDLRHQFVRIDFPGCEGKTVQRRKVSVRLRTLGTFPGAKVTRGKHWVWEDQDGGPGSEGEVTGYEDQPALDSSRNLVRVQWSQGDPCNIYRLGLQGHVDLTCVEEEAGPFYYRNHLPPFDILSFNETDSPVTSQVSPAEITTSKVVASDDGGAPETLAAADKSRDVTPRDDMNAFAANEASMPSENVESKEETKRSDTNSRHRENQIDIPEADSINEKEDSRTDSEVNRAELKRATEFVSDESKTLSLVAGDRVAIKVRAERLRDLQQSCGGCPPELLKAIGSTGTVSEVSSHGEVSVKFQSDSYILHPDFLVKVHELTEGATVRIRPDEDEEKVLNSRVGWKPEMDATIGKTGRVLKIDNDGDAVVAFGLQFFMFSPACCLPAGDGAKPDSLTNEAGNEKSDRGSISEDKPVSDEKTPGQVDESVQDLYRKLRQAIQSESVMPDEGDVRELMAAVTSGDRATVRRLCKAHKSIIEAEFNGATPFLLALERGSRQTVDLLLELGADVNHCVPPVKTPLSVAIAIYSDEFVELLLERGTDPVYMDPLGHNYIHSAVFCNLPRSIRALAAYGVDVNHKDDFEDTPLHLAIDKRMNESVEALVALDNIDFTVKNKRGHPPLHTACLRGNARAAQLILERDKSQLTVFTWGSSPLHIAAQNDNDECVRVLVLEGEADINLQRWEGSLYTPLHLACIRGKFRAAEALVELGADIHLKDRNGDTALHLCIAGRQEQDSESEAGQQESHMRVAIACMLISRGAYIDAENNKGRNPLTYGIRPVRDGVREFVKSNPELVKRESSKGNGMDQTSYKSMGFYSSRGTGQKAELKEALKGVGLPCGLCGTPRSDVTLHPCQHKCVCSTCSDKVERCPLCEEKVTDKVVTGPDEKTVKPEECKQM